MITRSSSGERKGCGSRVVPIASACCLDSEENPSKRIHSLCFTNSSLQDDCFHLGAWVFVEALSRWWGRKLKGKKAEKPWEKLKFTVACSILVFPFFQNFTLLTRLAMLASKNSEGEFCSITHRCDVTWNRAREFLLNPKAQLKLLGNGICERASTEKRKI